MPRGTHLSLEERRVILRLFDSGFRVAEIAEATQRSRRAVKAVLDEPGKMSALPRSGRPPKLSATAKRRLVREASKGESSARELNVMLDLPVSVSRTRAVLSSTPHLRYSRVNRGPMLTPTHVLRRKNWATEKVTWNCDAWSSVIWSDEKMDQMAGRATGTIYGGRRRCFPSGKMVAVR